MAYLHDQVASRLPAAPFTSAQTMFWFGLYLAIVAAALYAVPALFLSLFWLPEPTDPWVRVLAIPMFNLSVVTMAIGRLGARDLVGVYTVARSWVILLMALLVTFGLAPPIILLFGAIDLVCASLTFWALASEARSEAAERRRAAAV